jgi:phospholipid transport system substrate-binding protein
MKKLFAIACFALLAASPVFADVTPPDQLAHEVSEKITSLIKTNRDAYTKDHKKLFAMVNEQLAPHFEFRKIAQQVIGPSWRSATEEQRTRFADEFRNLMVRTYGTALLKFTDQKIVYQPLKVADADRTAVVKSTIVRTGGAPPVAINYSFLKTDAGWKVYDVAIEGPSIVTTYQRVYAERLRQGGLDKLIETLAQENKNAEAGGASPTTTGGASQ